MSRRLRVLIAGAVGDAEAQGGAAWAVMQYVLGLRNLGHEAHVARSAGSAAYFTGFDVVLNISGLLPAESIAAVPIRVYLDLDPAFNQLWHAQGIARGFEGHTHHVTVGQAIGRAGCDVPTHGFQWIATPPPVVLEEWPVAEGLGIDAMTSVANFRSYGPVVHDGVHYGQKVHSLRALHDLPRRAGGRFLLAMAIQPEDHVDRASLEDGGWELVDPDAVARTPSAYRSFVQSSRAEIGVAKSGYVNSRCGWFSDRSACYLASGRPVIAQDTGFADFLPVGCGLLTFGDADSAIEAIEDVRRDYRRHARSARRIAEEHFDSDRVLSRLLQEVGA